MGTIHPDRIWRNNTPQAGDVLFLTKKLGIGIITTAYSAGEVSRSAFDEAAASMTYLNKYAAEILRNFTVHACTDVTGFGLSGHLSEMTGTDFTAHLDANHIPYIEAAYQAAGEFLLTAGGQRNRNFAQGKIQFSIKDFALEEIIFDPQTSGGLLFAVSPAEAEKIRPAFAEAGISLFQIGAIEPRADYPIVVR